MTGRGWWMGALALAVGLGIGGCRPKAEPAQAQATMLDGKAVTVEQFRGKPLVLNFWATWCPPCRTEMPALEKAYLAYKDRGIQFLAVALDDTDAVRKFVQDNQLTLPVAVDEERGLAKAHQISAIPTTYFMNSDGTTASQHIGGLRYEEFLVEIEKLK